MINRKVVIASAIALTLVVGSGIMRIASADRVQDATQFSQAQPECPKDPDDDCK
ncbi:MAG: hypothetical protein HC820_08645 [Hydrococcus sp. RM1_1_31]|nr:hypothetical protein [Hydrococcus sp. RM1_1_31]